jgi:hypothetical protein
MRTKGGTMAPFDHVTLVAFPWPLAGVLNGTLITGRVRRLRRLGAAPADTG